MQFLERLEQICIEDQYNRNQIREYIEKELESSKQLLEPLRKKAIRALYDYFDKEYTYDSKNDRLMFLVGREGFSIENILDEVLVATINENKPTKIQKIVGKLAPYFEYEDIWDSIKTAAEILTVVGIHSNFYNIIQAKNSESGSIEIISNFKLDSDILAKIEKMQYLPPLVCQPNKIHYNYQSVYLTKNDSIILGKCNHHEEYQALDVINIANRIELSLDLKIVQLDEPIKFKNEPKTEIARIERIKNMQNLIANSKKVYQELISAGNKFYLSWKFDKRGRMYSMGYHVNIQSTEYKKALINFHKKELIKLD